MTLVSKLVGPPTAEGAAVGVPDTLSWRDVFLGAVATTGKTVNVETSMGIPALWGAMRILTDAVGSMPLITYDRTSGAGRQEAFSAPVYRLLRYRPNPEMTATHLWRQVMFHLNAWGNSYLSKIFDAQGNLVELWPVRPDRVRVYRRGGVKQFQVADTFGRWTGPYTTSEIIHVQGISFDGLLGISPIEAAREAIGLGLALDEYTNRFFANGAVPRVVLQSKGELSQQAAQQLSADWKSKYGGLSKAHSTAVLEEGLDVKVLSFPLRDLQFVEQMQWSAGDISRIFRVPASKLNISSGDSMTYKTAEGETLDFLTFSVQGWLTLIEQALTHDDDVFPDRRDRPGQFAEFKADAILRVDTKTRFDAWSVATGGRAWMHPSEVRPSEGLPPDTTFDDLAPAIKAPTGPTTKPGSGSADAG